MGNLSNPGRIFFGIAIAGMGLLTIYYGDFPYMLILRSIPDSGIVTLAIFLVPC